MKEFLIILLSLVLSVSMFAFAACSDTPADDDPQTGNEQTGGDDGQDGTQPDGDDENAGDDTTEAQPPHTAGDPDSDTLVVYFSWSSSLNTEHMAEYIAEATGGYLVEIVPEEPYVGSYNDVAYGRAHALLLPPHIRSLPSRAVETALLLFPRICFASAREP